MSSSQEHVCQHVHGLVVSGHDEVPPGGVQGVHGQGLRREERGRLHAVLHSLVREPVGGGRGGRVGGGGGGELVAKVGGGALGGGGAVPVPDVAALRAAEEVLWNEGQIIIGTAQSFTDLYPFFLTQLLSDSMFSVLMNVFETSCIKLPLTWLLRVELHLVDPSRSLVSPEH